MDHPLADSVAFINATKAEFPPQLVTLQAVQWSAAHTRHRCAVGRGGGGQLGAGCGAGGAALRATRHPPCSACVYLASNSQHPCFCLSPTAPLPDLATSRYLVGESGDAMYVAFMGTKVPRDMVTNANLFQVGGLV